MVCELCSSGDFTKDDEGMFVCDYCRAKYTPLQAKALMVEGVVQLDRSADVEKLLSLSKTSLENENATEAYDYASRALEIDPSNVEAWMHKGAAAGWSSTIQQPRLTEMIGSFRNALELSSEDERNALLSECSDKLNSVAVAVGNLSMNHAKQFALLEDVWSQHIRTTESVISAYWQAYEWSPEAVHMQNLIFHASELIKGVRWSNGVDNGVRFLSTSFEAQIRQTIELATEELRKFEPDYTPPTAVRPTPNACFVVTATMGSETALPVTVLREFRDTVLVQSRHGRQFIAWYRANGPRLADQIRNRIALRIASLVLVVLPASGIAWVTTRVHSVLRTNRETGPLQRHSQLE